MTAQKRQALIDKVERDERLTEAESILYFQEVLGFSAEDAEFAATQKRKKEEMEATGSKVYF